MRRALQRLTGVCLALLCLEGLTRSTFGTRTVAEADFPRVNAPGIPIRWGREGHATSHWEAHGVRRGSLPPNPSAKRVLVLGDSVTESLQVNDDQTFEWLTETKLTRAAGTRVLNVGHSRFSLADYIFHAPRNVRVFAPDWVVVAVEESDFTTDAWAPAKPHLRLTETGDLESIPVNEDARSDQLFRKLENLSRLVPYTLVRVREFRAAFATEPPLFRAGAAERKKAPAPTEAKDYHLDKQVDALAKAYAGRVTILYLPPFSPTAPHAPESDVEARVRAAALARGIRFVVPRAAWEDLARRHVAPYGFENLGFNEGHMNPDGHRAVAEVLAKELDDALF